MGHNELLIGEAVRGRNPGSYQVSIRFEVLRDATAAWIGYDARPQAV
jgi:hypothetical protein